MGHGEHLDCSMFLNHLYNAERVFSNLIQVASLPLVFLAIASFSHRCPSYHSLQQFHLYSLDPALFHVFCLLANLFHQPPSLPRLWLLGFSVAVSRYILKSLVMSWLQFVSLCSALCLTSFVPHEC